MLIIDSKRNGVMNFDNAKYLAIDNEKILAGMVDGRTIVVAEYDTPKRAEEVFLEILNGIANRRVDVIPMPEK